MAKPAKIIILGDSKDAARAFKQIRDEAGQTETRLGKVSAKMTSAGKSMTRNVTLPLLGAAAGSLKLLEAQEKAEAQLESVLRSTGGAANVTADHVKDLASSLQEVTTFGDEATISGANLLLTFKNIRNEAGDGNDVFDQTTKVMLDMSTAMDQDLKSSAIQLGKALNDPITGLSALSRVGITFTEDQKHLIKTLQESGDIMGAQKIILAELESQFGGSAEAMAETTSGQLKQAMNDLGDAGESVGEIIAPVAIELAELAKSAAESFQNLSPETQEMIIKLGGVAAAIGPVLFIGGKLIGMVSTLRTTMGKAAGMMVAGGPWGLAIAGAITALGFLIKAHMDSKARIEEWRGVLKEGGDAIGEHTDEILTAQFANERWMAGLENAGLTIHDVRAALEDEAEAQRVTSALRLEGLEHIASWIDAQNNAITEAERLEQAERDLGDELNTQKDTFGGLISGGIQPYMQATDDATDSTGELEDATKSLADEQRALVDPLFNLRQRTLDLVEAQDEYNVALVDHGPKSREAEDAAVDLAEAQLEANAAAERYAAEGGPASLEAVEDLLREGGLLEEQIAAIIERILELNNTTVEPKDFPRQGGGSGGGEQVFHEGGRIPGSSPRRILAHGGETVLATHKMSPLAAFADQFGGVSVNGSGGGSVIVNVHGSVVTEQELVDSIITGLARARRRGVKV